MELSIACRLEDLDLEPIVIKAMDKEEGKGWSFAFALAVAQEYRRFLALCAMNPDTSIVPSSVVDDFWHLHILDTSKYQDDCQRFLGYFLHHFPYFGMRGERDAKNLKAAWEGTLALYHRTFGEAPSPEFWPHSQRCPSCGRRCRRKQGVETVLEEKRAAFCRPGAGWLMNKFPIFRDAPFMVAVLWLVLSVIALLYMHHLGANPDWIRAAGFFLAGAGIAPLALWLAYKRTSSLSDQIDNESARRVTDAFTKAVELLGNTDPAVRQGGIAALGRLAKENESEHPKIIDIVAAYIRHRSPAKSDASRPERLDIDIDAAVAVIRDRNREFDKTLKEGDYLFDLSGCYLVNADLSLANLVRVNLTDCVFQGCLFRKSDLSEADMNGSEFPESEFQGTKLDGADIGDADFSKASEEYLTQAQLDSAIGDELTKVPPWLQKPKAWSR